MSTKSYADEVWVDIRREWLAGQLSHSEISRSYGPSRQAILKRAKKEKWPARGTLIEEVRREISAGLVTEGVTAGVTPSETDEIIQGAAKRGLRVIQIHKGLLDRLLAQVDVTLSEIEEMERIRLTILKEAKLKERKGLVTAIIGSRIGAMEAVAKILAKAIPLERQAFSLDTEKGEIQSITYVTPKIKKPAGSGLSEEEWKKE